MALVQRLDLRQSQTLVMTPQLQQAIKLLQLSNFELVAYVEAELERNPLLERDEAATDGAPDTVAEQPEAPETPGADVTGTDALTRSETLAVGDDAPLDADYGNVFTGASATDRNEDFGGDGQFATSGRGGRSDFEDDPLGLDQTLASRPTLREHLLGQVAVEFAGAADRLIAMHLVDLLDDAGYLSVPPEAVAERFGCPAERVATVLRRCQRLDPTGVFARSLAECLGLQLAERDRLDPTMQALLDHLALLGRHDYAGLLRVCGGAMEDLADMIAELRTLDPKPGARFAQEVAQTVVPDILMRSRADGGWTVELNTDTLPRVLVNQRYHATITRGARSKADRDYIGECLASANWLVKSLHQRATTILKVATEIVRQQDGFFLHGVQHLRPLILRDIAEAIGMHESTVSRVTSNKFMATPRGVFELKYFFTAAIQGADGAAAHSAEAVRFRIKTMIDGEPPAEVLSDDRIVALLRADGIDIARRTVAKYREGMRIPSSVQRKREKGLRP
jgi:RNA polymerase sigma-54 factor